jgi:hypothetical protein
MILTRNKHLILKYFIVLQSIFAIATGYVNAQSTVKASTYVNFNIQGKQVTRYDQLGDAIDAHDGEIALFNGVYYLYGTSYDCGFEWGNKIAPFCGFKTYSSTDMVNWTDRGFLFDAKTEIWQTRCDGKTYGCFRPHVIFNSKTQLYVLWINVYDNRVGYRVFTSKTPVGPFTEVAQPTLAVNSDMPVAGLNNGDHDTFVDDDGTAYLAYTDWRAKGAIAIEKLSDDYLTGTGEVVKSVTKANTEAPCLFKRNGIYYVIFSDPNCGYCSGTGASYCTAKSPLGPWSAPVKISDNSCGGQPSFVSALKISGEMVYIFGSDLWNNAAKNEALANYYWAPLTFAANGDINPMECQKTVTLSHTAKVLPKPKEVKNKLDNTSGNAGFTTHCDIGNTLWRAQNFTAKRTGKLSVLKFTTSKSGYPDAGLTFELYKAGANRQISGKPISAETVDAATIGWSPKVITVKINGLVKAGAKYALVVHSVSTKGCYSFQYNDLAPYPGGGASISNDGGKTFTAETNRTLRFETYVQ